MESRNNAALELSWTIRRGLTAKKKKNARYFLQEGQLYQRGFNNPYLKCLSRQEGELVLKEINAGCCGDHTGYKNLVRITIRVGFYWAALEEDARRVVKACDPC